MFKNFFIFFIFFLHKGINGETDDIENVTDANTTVIELNNFNDTNFVENCTDINDITNITDSVFIASSNNQTNITMQDKCSQCELPERYFDNYKQKGCVAVYRKDCPKCYKKFECPPEEDQVDSLSCKYAGKIYEIGARIDDNNPCTKCYCHRGFTSATIGCALIECPEIFSYSLETKSGCFLAYVPNSCCLTEFCNYNKPNNTCFYENVKYEFGSQFFPSIDPCLTCTCTEHFDKKNPLAECNKITCPIEDDDRKGCLPVYHNNICCPIEYVCPAKLLKDFIVCIQPRVEGNCNDNLERYYFNGSHCEKFIYTGCGGNENNFVTNADCMDHCMQQQVFLEDKDPNGYKCYFDGKNYEIGEFFTKDENITCTCHVPPLLQCVKS